jgi:hypothetical protein
LGGVAANNDALMRDPGYQRDTQRSADGKEEGCLT